MADENDNRLSFVDSPWAQIGVPLAAMAATAIAPRHAGPAAAMGLGAFNSMQNARYHQMRLSEVTSRQKAQQEEQQARMSGLLGWLDANAEADDTTPDAPAPEGGEAPQTDMTAKTEALEQGVVPKQTFRLSRETAELYKRLAPIVGPDKVGEMVLKDFGSYNAGQQGNPLETILPRLSEQLGAVPGASVSGIPLQGGGSFALNPPEQKAPPTPSPYLDARAGVPEEQLPEFARKWNEKTPQSPDQIVYGSDGQAYWANPRNHRIEPMRLSGYTEPNPQNAAQSGASTPVGPSGQPPKAAAGEPQLPQNAPAAGSSGAPLSFSRSSGVGSLKDSEVSDIGDAVIRGEQPPVLTGMGRAGAGKVRAYLARQGYNLAEAETDWRATQRFMATLNGPQQLRMRQAVNNAYHQIDVIEDLAKEWAEVAPQSGFRVLNKATLVAAANTPGRAGGVAQALLGQINDLTSELANVYMGGNSPTDHSMSLAAENLRADFNEDQFAKVFPLLRRNLKIRDNSMKSVGVAGVSGNSTYGHQSTDLEFEGGAAPAQPQQSAAPDYRSAVTKRKEAAAQGSPETMVSKSGRPMRKNAQGQWEYADQ